MPSQKPEEREKESNGESEKRRKKTKWRTNAIVIALEGEEGSN